MSVYIRNPFDRKGVRTNEGTHNVIKSDYAIVSSYDTQDNQTVYLYDELGNQGSGAFYSKYMIVTAKHVVNDGHNWDIKYGQIDTNNQFLNNTVSSSSSRDTNIGSISWSNNSVKIATITSSTPYQGTVYGLVSAPVGGNKKQNSSLKTAVVEGFPGRATVDQKTGEDLQILFSDADMKSPIVNDELYREAINVSSYVGGIWNDPRATLAAGNSGGPVFIKDSEGQTFIVGGLDRANATGPIAAQSTAPNAGLGATGYIFTPDQERSLTEAARAADPNGRKSGWWLTEPTNRYFASDTETQTIGTDSRTDLIVAGDAATDFIGSLGDDDYLGNGKAGSDIRFAVIDSDDDTTKSILNEISSVRLSVQMGAAGRGDMTADVTDTNGGLSNQTISGIQSIILSKGDDVVDINSRTIEVADSGSDVPTTALSNDDPIFVDGGEGKNTFNIDYKNSLDGKLLLQGGTDSDTFNINNADNAYETVLWAGSGNNVFNINTSGKSDAHLLTINIDGMTRDYFNRIDMAAFDTFLDQNYGADPHRIVVINAGADDRLNLNGNSVSDPQSFTPTSVTSNFFNMQYRSNDTSQSHSLRDGPGTTIDGYTGDGEGFVPDQWQDKATSFYQYGLTDGTNIFSAGASLEDLNGNWRLHIGTPSDVTVTTYYTSDPQNGVQTFASNINPDLLIASQDHAKSDFANEYDHVYDNDGQEYAYGYHTGSRESANGVDQTINTNGGLSIQNLTQGAFGLGMHAEASLPGLVIANTLYNVGSWSSYELGFYQPGDTTSGPNNVIGYTPNFDTSSVASSDVQTIDFDQGTQGYFDYGAQVGSINIADMTRPATIFAPNTQIASS